MLFAVSIGDHYNQVGESARLGNYLLLRGRKKGSLHSLPPQTYAFMTDIESASSRTGILEASSLHHPALASDLLQEW